MCKLHVSVGGTRFIPGEKGFFYLGLWGAVDD